VPIVVALTKIDKRNANPEKVKQELAEIGLTPMDWDGDTFVVPVSAVKGDGIDDLLEALVLTADEHEIIANPAGAPFGTVLEARMDKFRGAVSTFLVLNGTLSAGDMVVAGSTYGRVKAMFDEAGKTVRTAGPSMPVQVLGLHELPQPGDSFEVVKNEKDARALVESRRLPEKVAAGRSAVSLEDFFKQFSAGEAKEMLIILKVDVQGSLQPIVDSLTQLSETNKEGVRLRILQADAGNISESDVMLASASGAIVFGFNVDIDNAARRSADSRSVEIRMYSIIYKLLEDVELALKGLLEPVYEEKTIGVAEVRQVFRISKVGTIAGCMIRDGEARRNARARVRRGSQILATNQSVSSLKRVQDDVREVRTGFECGIGLSDFEAFETGDLIEFYISERVS
jgi:translation initiation factor IF-2